MSVIFADISFKPYANLANINGNIKESLTRIEGFLLDISVLHLLVNNF